MKLHSSKIVTSEYDFDDIFYNSAYGYIVYDSHPLASIKGDKLYLGSNILICDYDYTIFNGKIPSLYVIREKESNRFVCGLDLCDDGNIVECMTSIVFNSVESALNYVKSKTNKDLCIYMEDEMSL